MNPVQWYVLVLCWLSIPALWMRHSQSLVEWRTSVRLSQVFHNSLCVPLPGPSPVGALSGSLLWCFRYSTESYLLLLRRVNSHLFPGTPPGSTFVLSISHPTKPLQLFGRVGKYPKDIGKNLCYVSYVEIYILYLFHSENITIST